MSDTRSSTTAAASNAVVLLAGVVFVSVIAAYVALTLADKPTDGLTMLAGPSLGALIVSGQLFGQNRTLDKIERQTNGVLDKRIEDGTLRALATVGVVSVPPGSTTPVEPVTPPSPGSMADLPLERTAPAPQ
ncbi:hypothetical protein ACOCJ5_10270 [Knoellia sp. CPCC 206450]|uniref:hypothetical protein n=1 Tax=Knoellia tibetensis TaxID=3404798 RepID=UPI003B43C574